MVKKSLRTYQLYKQNLKIWFLFLLVSLLTACTQKPMPKPEQVSSIAPVLSWTQQATPERIDNPNIPNCEPLDLKPIKSEEIINIDDVVQNCTYQKGYVFYNPFGWGSSLPYEIKIWKNFLTEADFYNQAKTKIICEYKQDKKYELETLKPEMHLFIEKYKDRLILSWVYQDLWEDLKSIEMDFPCSPYLGHQLLSPVWWENKKHFFYHGAYEFWDEKGYIALVIDDKIYYPWVNVIHPKVDTLILQGEWKISKLNGDKAIVKRYTNWKLLPRYKEDRVDLDAQLFDQAKKNLYANKQLPTLWTFQLETCEIPL